MSKQMSTGESIVRGLVAAGVVMFLYWFFIMPPSSKSPAPRANEQPAANLALSTEASAKYDRIYVRSDPNAEYFLIERAGPKDKRTATTLRIGKSGAGYSKRLFNCGASLVKYLGTGDTLEQANVLRPDDKFAEIVPGSIADDVRAVACN